ncbi:hypothetical protein IV102_13310 [bacterium]|nr:hypothetical protein [bacterium]
MRQLFLVERSLMRDLADSSRRTGRWDTAPVACGAGSLSTGDALAVVVPGAGTEELKIDAAGNQIANQLVTYYLAVAPGIVQAFAPDAAGYEDQCPFKWLIRKNEAASQVPPNWLQGSVIEQPTSLWRDTQRKVVATDLLQLRIRRTPPTWEIEVSAVAIADARRKSALGAQPLSGSVFVIVHRFGVIART